MRAVVRTYSGPGAKKLAELLEERKKDVESAMRPVKGFASYTLLRTADGCTSITVCHDKAGTDESIRVAADWIKKNAPAAGVGAPSVSEGSIILHFAKSP